jgi:hypothetical protein
MTGRRDIASERAARATAEARRAVVRKASRDARERAAMDRDTARRARHWREGFGIDEPVPYALSCIAAPHRQPTETDTQGR